MKKLIFTLFCFALTMQFSFAQQAAAYRNGSSSPDSVLYNASFDTSLNSICTLGFTGNFVSNTGYANGTNSNNDKEKLEKYYLHGKIKIEHVLAFFYLANQAGNDDTIKAVLRDKDGNLIAESASLNMSDIVLNAAFNPGDNSSSFTFGMTLFTFNGPVPIYTGDSAYVGVTLPTQASDSLSVASADGCAGSGLTWEKRSDNSLHRMSERWGNMGDLYIFPVYTYDGSLTTSTGVTLNGLTLNAAYPNPTNNSVNLNYAIDKSSNVRVEIYNTVGQQVMSKSLGNQNPGTYTQNIDMSKLAKGTYFYSIITNNSRLFGQIAVQ